MIGAAERPEIGRTTAIDSDPLLASDLVVGAVDYRGRPTNRSASGRWTSALFIIVVEMAERFAYYGVSSNLISYLTGPLRESTATAAVAVNSWSGAATMLPLLGAFLADSYLGRYRTIVIASLLYMLGLSLLTLSSILPSHYSAKCGDTAMECPPSQLQVAFFYASLYLMAFAQGGHKPCVQAFGADQFDENDPAECMAKSSFFNWWLLGLSGSIIFAIMILSYVQDYIGWGMGFGIPCIAMTLALVVFLLGTKTYRFYPRLEEKKSPFTITRETLVAAEEEQGERLQSIVGGHGEDARGLLRLLPTWATCLIYAVVTAQPTTLFTKQGSTMDRRIGSSNLQVPPAALQTFINISIFCFIPIYDRILVPVCRKFTKHPSGITMLQRVATGMATSVIAMVIAALVETKRLRTAREFRLVDQPTATIPMSFWWLVPQYVLYGISDVFAVVGLQEFFYDQVPDAFRSLGLAIYLSIFGIGSFISGFLVSVIDKTSSEFGESWFSNNLNRAHLDYFYWLLAGLSACGLLLYLRFAQAYQYKKKRVSTVM